MSLAQKPPGSVQGNLILAQGHQAFRLVPGQKTRIRQGHVLGANPPAGKGRLDKIPGPIHGNMRDKDRCAQPQGGILEIIEGKAFAGPGRIQEERAARRQHPQIGVAHGDARSAHGRVTRQILQSHDMHPAILRVWLQVLGVPLLGAKASYAPGDIVYRQGRFRLMPGSEKAFQSAFVHAGLLRQGNEQLVRYRHGLADPLRHIKHNVRKRAGPRDSSGV